LNIGYLLKAIPIFYARVREIKFGFTPISPIGTIFHLVSRKARTFSVGTNNISAQTVDPTNTMNPARVLNDLP
jgi:hypothetical protein